MHFLIRLKKKILGINSLAVIGRFHPRGQQLCKLIGTKDKKIGATLRGLLKNSNVAAVLFGTRIWRT